MRVLSIGKWGVRVAVLALAATVAISGGRTIAADPPPPPPDHPVVVPPTGHFGVQAAPSQYIAGTLGVGGTTCVGSIGCASDYTAVNELDVIGTSIAGGPVINMMSNRADQLQSSRWLIYANPTGWYLQDYTAGLGIVPFA